MPSPTFALLAVLMPAVAGIAPDGDDRRLAQPTAGDPQLHLAGVRIDPRPGDPALAVSPRGTARPDAPRQAARFRDHLPDGSPSGFCPDMSVVPAGRFTMGTPAAAWATHEGPQHAVKITRTFAIGRFEVTFAQWDACVDDGGCGSYRPHDDGLGRGQRPVGGVSHADATAFVTWLNRRLDLDPEVDGYRLPSEAEWEYAARAGSRASYWWGGRAPVCVDGAPTGARFDDGGRCDAGGATAVGSYAANRFGLHDVAGNLREWVADCWHDSYHAAPTDGSAWLRGGDCVRSVVRGGSWRDRADTLRASWRTGHAKSARFPGNGFRVVRNLPTER